MPGLSQEDYKLFMRLLDDIQPVAPRWWAESDGDPNAKTYYVTNNFCSQRHDCGSMREAKALAKDLNALMQYI